MLIASPWFKCSHCGGIVKGGLDAHYCGAPWQTPDLVGPSIEQVPPAWADEMRARSWTLPVAQEIVGQLVGKLPELRSDYEELGERIAELERIALGKSGEPPK